MELSKAREMLNDFSFQEILELNDLEEEDALKVLLEMGLISEPSVYFESDDAESV